MRIKNWKLALLALVLFSLFLRLGFWQLARAHEKQQLLDNYAARTKHSPLEAGALEEAADLRFYQAKITGEFDNTHTFLLDNKIFNSQIGYEVYTPFHANGFDQPILIDRGFVPLGKDRSSLPSIKPILGTLTVTGMLNLAPAYVAFGPMIDGDDQKWPMRVEFIDLKGISKILQQPFFAYTLSLAPNHPAAYAMEWQVVTMGPERHLGYAVQWFAFAATLLILFAALNRNPKKEHN